MCRNLALGLMLLTATLCCGQEWPRGEVFGGYSLLNLDTRGITHHLDANGWEVSTTGNLDKWIGVEADGAGHYTSLDVFGTTVPIREYSVLAGPRLTYRTGNLAPFAHVLLGLDRVSANVLGFSSGNDNAFAMAAGAGVDLNLNSRIAARLMQGDFLLSQHNETSGASTQRNFRVAAGLVLRFGMQAEARRSAPAPVASQAPISIPMIGVRGQSDSPYGLVITDVQPGSAAELAGLRVGDIITMVGGRPLGTGEAVAAELERPQPGSTVSIRYLRQYWESDTSVRIRGR